MLFFLIVFHLLVALILIAVILLQRGSEDGEYQKRLGGAGRSGLTKITMSLGFLFLGNSLFLSYFVRSQSRLSSSSPSKILMETGEKALKKENRPLASS